jgi:hypothetical protein
LVFIVDHIGWLITSPLGETLATQLRITFLVIFAS